jgi:hypothetical protein
LPRTTKSASWKRALQPSEACARVARAIQQTCRGSFSAISKPTSARKHVLCTLCSIFQYPKDLYTSAPLQIEEFQNSFSVVCCKTSVTFPDFAIFDDFSLIKKSYFHFKSFFIFSRASAEKDPSEKVENCSTEK